MEIPRLTQISRFIVSSLALLVLRVSCQAATEGMTEYLECYRCSAYEYEADFDTKLSRCESGKVKETVRCPYSITRPEAGQLKYFELAPSCTVVKQKAAGAVTSYTRGCKFFHNCTEVDLCRESTDQTGVCMSCCDSDLCNSSPPILSLTRLVAMWTLAVGLAVHMVR